MKIGDMVKLIGTDDTYEVKAIDTNFENAGLAVAIWLPETQALEWLSATLVEPVTPSKESQVRSRMKSAYDGTMQEEL